MRFGEALRLERGDIDHEHDLLVVRDSKFGKSRELALHPSTITRLTYCTAHLAFKRIVDHAGLQPRSAGRRRTCAETAFAFARRMSHDRLVRSGKQRLRGLRLLAATAVTLALTPMGSAAAATKTVSFDDLAGTTRVSNQYQASSGVTFPPGGEWRQPYVRSAPLQAHSPSNLAVYDCTGLPVGACESYPTPRFRGVLSTSASSVSAYVGYFVNFSIMDTVKVRLLAYNADGMLQAESPFVTVSAGAPLTQQVTAAAPAATIDYFEIVADAVGDGSGGKQVAFDDLAIVTPDGPGAPNITLNPGQTVANVLAGRSVSLPVELNRHNVSDGDVSFTVSGLPAGMSASFSLNPVPGTGTTTTLTLTAAVDAPPSDAYSEITVTATPSLGAGPTPRTITKQVRVRSAFTMTRAGPPEVDLAPCSVKVPLGFVRDFGFAGPVSLSVTGMAAGVLASFDPSQVTFPNGAGAETVNLVVTGPATGVPVPPTVLTIRAGAPGLADRTATVTVRGTCPQQYDARVTSLEITQGTQSEVLPQRYLDHPASPIPYAEIPSTARLRRDGPTVVRVYANLAFGPTGGVPNVPLTLSGSYRDRFDRPKAFPGSPLSPISGLRRLKLGPEQATAAEAASETEAYTFVLPQDWTHAALTIGANLLPSLGGGSPVVAPCDSAACVQNDNMRLKNIPFVSARQVTVKPLQLTVNGVGQPDPVTVFGWTRMMLPLPLRVMPYQATIDITDVANDQTRCVAAAPLGTAGRDQRAACSNAANKGAGARVNDWTCDQGSGDRTWNIGVNTGVARGLKSAHWCWSALGTLHDAVVERNRPMTSVSHEFGHLLGRVHADTQCGGNSNGQKGEAWLPDGRGLLQSVGLATDIGTGRNGGHYATLAPPKEWFDYMSYCADSGELPNPLVDGNSWISVRNWNRILGSFDIARAASASHAEPHAAAHEAPPARARAAARPAVAALHVRGFASGGEASIVTVSPGRSPPQPSSNSAYHLVGLGAGGTPVVDVAMLQADVHTDGSPPSLTLAGVIPAAGVTSVAIVKTGTTFATRARSTNAPTVAMRGTPAFRRGTATVRWRARDADGGRLLATIDYSADGGRSFETVWTGQSRGIARFPARHLSRSARARVRVTVNDGFREASVTSPRFRSPGAPPVVTILSPARRLKQPNDAPLVLSGQAFDDRARALTGRRLTWRAGKRVLGTGERISATGLPAGRHRVDLLARDRAGRTGRASVVVVLPAARPLFLTVSAPRSVKRAAGSMRLKLVSSLPATLVVRAAGLRTQRFAVGRKARTITVRIPRGAKPLNLRLSLTAGTRSSVRSLLVTRR